VTRAARPPGLALAAVLLASGPANAASLRCDGGIIGRGDSLDTVLVRCGEPHHRSAHQKKLRERTATGASRVRIVDVEIWTYRLGYGRFIRYLTFEGGWLIRIDRGPREE
jgi:hypothetical protein